MDFDTNNDDDYTGIYPAVEDRVVRTSDANRGRIPDGSRDGFKKKCQ